MPADERQRPIHVWLFNENRRIYPKGGGRAIWREHWQSEEVVAETRVSWVTKYGTRIPKKRPARHRDTSPCFSEAEVDERVWAEANRYPIAERVRSDAEPATLRRIATLIGYMGAT